MNTVATQNDELVLDFQIYEESFRPVIRVIANMNFYLRDIQMLKYVYPDKVFDADVTNADFDFLELDTGDSLNIKRSVFSVFLHFNANVTIHQMYRLIESYLQDCLNDKRPDLAITRPTRPTRSILWGSN